MSVLILDLQLQNYVEYVPTFILRLSNFKFLHRIAKEKVCFTHEWWSSISFTYYTSTTYYIGTLKNGIRWLTWNKTRKKKINAALVIFKLKTKNKKRFQRKIHSLSFADGEWKLKRMSEGEFVHFDQWVFCFSWDEHKESHKLMASFLIAMTDRGSFSSCWCVACFKMQEKDKKKVSEFQLFYLILCTVDSQSSWGMRMTKTHTAFKKKKSETNVKEANEQRIKKAIHKWVKSVIDHWQTRTRKEKRCTWDEQANSKNLRPWW